jgi:hypothetical protein
MSDPYPYCDFCVNRRTAICEECEEGSEFESDDEEDFQKPKKLELVAA